VKIVLSKVPTNLSASSAVLLVVRDMPFIPLAIPHEVAAVKKDGYIIYLARHWLICGIKIHLVKKKNFYFTIIFTILCIYFLKKNRVNV
jgi:hypothetical protein